MSHESPRASLRPSRRRGLQAKNGAAFVTMLALSVGMAPRPGRCQGVQAPGAGETLVAPTPSAARIHEEVRMLDTYPFSEPDPVPILVRDPRLYPYHAFGGYSAESQPREWTVVTLENDYIQVFVLPEVGGKVWGAIVKETGHEFIYRNEVLKFRNIALRGPWTSGGIEFNFGVIGHTPSTATPVTHTLVENPDGSVSCWVGAMDLPSRTHWRVEVRLSPDRAYFETHVLWYNPTPLEQPYYNWMTAAAFARPDLEMSMPGNAYLRHSGQADAWPVDEEGRYLPLYANNTFDGHKSYHVVGELHDFFGGYYHDEDYGFGHWARYEDMPGQKLWLWALSREGGIWEDLLTDTDGQYVEFQAGRLFVQYSPGADLNPITQAGFDPLSAHEWSEIWFPLEGLGGLTEASSEGALLARTQNQTLTVGVTAFRPGADTLKVWSGENLVAVEPLSLVPLRPFHTDVAIDPAIPFRVEVPGLKLDYSSDPSSRRLARPFETDPEAWESVRETDRAVFQAKELAKARRYADAERQYQAALEEEPWNREALLGQAQLDYRSGLFRKGLHGVNRALQLDTYDPEANYLAGLFYQALGRRADAVDALGWASRAVAYRTSASIRLAEIMLQHGDMAEAERYASRALETDVNSIPARRILAVCDRVADSGMEESIQAGPWTTDHLDPFSRAEAFLASPGPETLDALLAVLKGEFPAQTLLELAIDYVRWGRSADATLLLRLAANDGSGSRSHVEGTPILQAWLAWLEEDPTLLRRDSARAASALDPAFSHPYRPETIPVLEWAASRSSDWEWTYFLALNLWALDRREEAASLFQDLRSEPDFGPFYVARAYLLGETAGVDPEGDLRRAVVLDPESRILHEHLIRYLQAQERWQPSLDALADTRLRFPESFELDLLEARALNHVGRPEEAVRLLENTHVLPSEGARESHRLYEQAHLLSALNGLESGQAAGARDHLLAALEWPESLGQGRPYDPEERTARFLLGLTYMELGMEADGTAQFDLVIENTDDLDAVAHRGDARPPENPLDLLAVPSLQLSGRYQETEALGWSTFSPGEMVSWFRAEFPQLFQGLDGTILSRALDRYTEVVR